MTTNRQELTKAFRECGQLTFMVGQVAFNLDYLGEKTFNKYEQEIVALYHDIASVVRCTTDLNRKIMKEVTDDIERTVGELRRR